MDHNLSACGSDDDHLSSARMVSAHQLTQYLSNAADLNKVSELACNLLFPGCFTSGAHHRAQEIASTSLIRSHKVVFDVAYTLVKREEFASASSVTRWAWADSSPQAGRDWFQCKEQYALDSSLRALADAVDTLICAGDAAVDLPPERERELNRTISASLRVHLKMPMAKAQGHSSVEDLVSCFAVTSFWDSGSCQQLRRLCHEHISFTSDLGTDSGIRSFQTTDVKSVLPCWLREEPLQMGPDLDDDLAERPGMQRFDLGPLLPFAIETPGCLHVMTNLPKDLENKLSHWHTHMAKLKTIAPLLTENYHRERFRATCLQGCLLEDRMFEHFSGSLYDKRWFTVYFFVARSHALVKVLVQRWDVRAYTEGFSRDKCDDERDRKFSPHSVSSILQDPMFHAYNHLLLAVGLILRRLTSWLEACPCHASYVRAVGTWRKKPRDWSSIFPEMSRPRCPVAGCRAPELASGCLVDMLHMISEFTQADLARKLPHDLCESDKSTIFHDYSLARSYLQFGLELKLDCWKRLPWCLAALGHHSAEVRSRAARDALRQHEGSMLAGFRPEMHHPLTLRWLAPGTLRDQVEACADGQPRGQELELAAAKLKFIPVVERAL